MGFKLNGIKTEGLPEHIVRIFTRNYDVPILVETGTAGGNSIRVAADIFKKCYTIELILDRPELIYAEHVHFRIGNSVDVLPEIISEFVGEYVFFFLDAHFCDSVPNTTGIKECPVLDELKIISRYQKCIILIDDARLFFGHPPYPADPRDWPMIEDIFAETKKLFPDHHTTIVDDYILVYPHVMGSPVIAEWTSRFNIRYPSAEDKLKSQVKDVYAAFKKYVNE
jgi:hypothetical protein